MLEAALKTLFDYQRFERDPALEAVIGDTLRRYADSRPLYIADDDLAMAAGGLAIESDTREPDDDGRGTI